MIRIPHGWYCDGTPAGAWVALVADSHLETDAGRVELPHGQNLLYVRMAPDGMRFAGVGHRDDLCWQWNVMLRRWDSHGLAFGPRAVSYAPDGSLQVIRHPPAAPTLHDKDRRIHEYTELGGLTIGHGGNGLLGEDPAIALIDGRRLIEEGQCRFFNATEADRVCIAYVREDTRESVIRWMTRDELRALPIANDAPIPEPIPVPVPEPEPIPMPTDNLDIIRQIRADYPTPLGARHWEFLVEVAQTLGVQLFRKEDSNSVLIPALMKRVSLDVIGRGTLGNRWVDILQDSEGLAIPVWQEHDFAAGEYVDVRDVELPGAQPVPVPVPEPPTGTLEERLRLLENQLAELRAHLRNV
jgi:hypothetical protein